ncbi:MAG: 1-acyl-sn-glycerol-3-phosphate acyltransferase [Deltaproteobacteria bacterium]|nr:1-acyl-sn-glycerol-3-phosphate acyltransferase [Deltaproteobacteria bacterium]
MLNGIYRYWRIFGCGLGFLAVGIGGAIVFPVLNVVIRQPQRRKVLARNLIRLTFRGIARSMSALGVFQYETTGLQRLERRGLLILANHPTLIDIVFLMAFVPQADCIVKAGLWRNPFTRATVRAAGYIRNDNDSVRVIEDCIASLRDGGNLIIFPEGTRTTSGASINLKRGAAHIAVRAECIVTPILIRCVPPMLVKGKKWWRLPDRSSRFSIDVKEDLDIRPLIEGADSDVLAARRLTAHLQRYFSEETHGRAAA